MDTQVIDKLKETFKGPLLQENENANVGKSERILSVATGAFILFQGITNIFSHPIIALAEVAVGGSLMQRGVTGYCAVKAMMEDNCQTEAVHVPVTTPVTSNPVTTPPSTVL
ncbi:DUF2892 domain-containing protein [Arcticibacter sp. MXS-1]|uniref:YgaP family membrane protein n=1 Tax=Arcticibacter sp. MXS-1 TaxID=3341726 RepID=UPI0035A8E6CA